MPSSLRPFAWVEQVSFSLTLSWTEVFSFPLSQPEPRQEVSVYVVCNLVKIIFKLFRVIESYMS